MTTCVLVVLVASIASRSQVARISWACAALLLALLTKETAIAAPALLLVLGLIRTIRRPVLLTAAVSGGPGGDLSDRPLQRAAAACGPFPCCQPVRGEGAPGSSVRDADRPVPRGRDAQSPCARHPVRRVRRAAADVRRGPGRMARPWLRRARQPRRGWCSARWPLSSRFSTSSPDLLGSRYLYLALTGWALLLATSANSLSPRAGRAMAPLLCLIAFWIPATRSHLLLWQNAAATRERILAAAAGAADPGCPGWIVSGVPATLEGVPLFVNGFPEAARPWLGEPIHMAPAAQANGQCQLTWTGEVVSESE